MDILLVDDEALLRQGLRKMLRNESFIENVYEAGSIEEARVCLGEHRVDVVLLDIRLKDGNGMGLLSTLHAMEHRPKVIAVTGLDGKELIFGLIKAGINGIIHKREGYREIIHAITTVMGSGSYFPPATQQLILNNTSRLNEIPPVMLSSMEMDILQGIAKGQTTKEIATQLKMAVSTAETYRVKLMKKVGVSNTASLLSYAFRNGIL